MLDPSRNQLESGPYMDRLIETADTPEACQIETPNKTWVKRFDNIYRVLKNSCSSSTPSTPLSSASQRTRAFFEVYFANWTSHSTLAPEHVKRLLESPSFHSIEDPTCEEQTLRNMWHHVNTPTNEKHHPMTLDNLICRLRQSHKASFSHCNLLRPGRYRISQGYAGSTRFVKPCEIEATLKSGLKRVNELPEGFLQAVMLHHVIIGTHPFVDGNGRTSRFIINSVLTARNQSRIIMFPKCQCDYRESHRLAYELNYPEENIKCLREMQMWNAHVKWGAFENTVRYLRESGLMRP